MERWSEAMGGVVSRRQLALLGIASLGALALGGRPYDKKLLADDVLVDIAKAHGVSPAQAAIRWHLQRGVVAIPGFSNPEHIREDNDVYGFGLSDEEMTHINALGRHQKHDWY